jgi:photosystem II stability/assembly factor-like uncharacterized protein
MGKRIYFILLMLINWPMASFSQGNWELLFPLPTSNHMVGMYFIDDKTGWAVGEYCTILKSTDGGANWIIREIPWLFDLSDVHFPTALTGYAVGTDGFIIKTTNGGETWNQLENRYSNNLNRILFRDESNGWIIGEKGLILHTSDGGATWSLQPTNNPYTKFHGIDLIGTDDVIIVGEQETILITNDEGQNWQPVSWDSSETKTYSFEDVYFVDELHGWIGGGVGLYTTLLATVDGGQTWAWIEQSGGSFGEFGTINFDPYLGPLQQIYFFDDMKTGIGLFKACNQRDYGNIPMKTSDGGQNWSAVMYGHSEQYDGKGRFCVLDDKKIICTGYHGDFWYSTDKGKEWHLSAEEQRWWQDLTIRDNGQLLVHKYCMRYYFHGGDIDQFAHSSDYGTTWSEFKPVFLDSNDQPLSVYTGFYFKCGEFLNNQDTLWTLQYIKGDTLPAIFISTDFGYTYKEIGRAASAFNPFFSTFLTPDTLIFHGFDSYEITPNVWAPIFRFIYSFDRGATVNVFKSTDLWNSFSTGIFLQDRINAHYFFNSHKGFLVGTDGNIVKTQDTGQSWENIYSGVVEDLHDITFIDKQTGFVVGDFGRILKTDDGGTTWRKTDSGTQENVYSIGFINDHEGWVGTENGLRYTTDAGETWQGVPLRYSHGKYENLVFDEAGNGYAYTFSSFGHGGYADSPCSHMQVLRMRNSEIGINDSDSETLAPKAITLFQNYPNPFNATTQIEYQIAETGNVSLKIYNMQGQLVRTLVNKTQNAGEYSVQWDGTTNSGNPVASGLFVYQLQYNDQIANRKLLLLK